MNRFLRALLPVLLFYGITSGYCSFAYSQERGTEFSLVFGWKTNGSEKLLARKATAIKQLKTEQGVAINFGSLLGSTRIVDYDQSVEFLKAAKQAGFDYVIPAAAEFMFGVRIFKQLAERPDSPRFISSNLVDEKTHTPVVEPYAMWYVSGRRICIIAMSDTEIIKQAADAHVAGLDIIPYDEALNNVLPSVIRENADLVIVAGRMDRPAVMQMVEKHPFVDIFITNNQSGGFSDSLGTTTTVFIAGKPVYIGSDAGDHLGMLTFRRYDAVESREFRDVIVGDAFPPDDEITARLSGILDKLEKEDIEESIIARTSVEVAEILKEVFDVDVVLLERQSLYYFPLEDSLTLYDVRRVVKPYEKVTRYTLKGSLLKSVWEQSNRQTDEDLRLLSAGITPEGKVNSIPIQDDIDYTVLTTTHLRSGGNGYKQFTLGVDETISDVNMLGIVESYLIDKEERIRKLAKPKIWELNLYLTMASNYNRKDIDVDKAVYGEDIPKIWRSYEDFYQGNFIISSMNNKLTMNKKIGKHYINSHLLASWSRTGSKTHTQRGIVYDEPRNSDPTELFNKYTYDLPHFPVKPYVDILVKSFLYSGAGKHPLTIIASSGATRSFPKLFGLNISIGIHGTRDYTTLKNSAGINSSIILKKEFPAGRLLKTPVTIDTTTRIKWDPHQEYYMAFQHENYNTIRFKIMEKVSLEIDVKTFSYRSTKKRKMALGFYYLLALSYGMNWKF